MSAELIFPGDGFDGFIHFLYNVPIQPELINGSIGHSRLSVMSNQAKGVSFGSTIAIVSEKSEEWAENYKALKAYHAKHGNCSVPFGKDTGGLRSWTVRQKMLYNEGDLEQSKIDDLKQLNLDFDTEPRVSARTLNYAPPRGLPRNSSLLNYSEHSDQGKGSEENAEYTAWFENYEALKAYHAKRGDCAVPFGKKTGSLRSWLERQKKLHKDGQLESGKVEYLRALNVDLDGASPRGQAAKKQKTEEADAPGTPGGASVRVSHGAMPVKAKRGVKKSIGVIEGPQTWDHNYAVLKMYKEEHGTVELTPGESKEMDALLGWAGKQKKAHSKADLNYGRINLLEELGMKLS